MAVVAPDRVDRMISRVRVHMRAATLVQVTLLAAVVLSGIANPQALRIGDLEFGTALLIVAAIAWVVLVSRSARQSQLIQYALTLMGQGLSVQAAPFLAEAVERFSVFRLSKLLALQHLAAIAHSQRDFDAATRLASEVLRYDLARRKGLDRVAALVLADSLLEMNDPAGAGGVLGLLHGQPLSISERLQVMPVVLRWQIATGRYREAIDRIEEKVQLAQLLDAEPAGLVHVLLAAAANYRLRSDLALFLLRRAALYTDLDSLAERVPSVRPFLAELRETA